MLYSINSITDNVQFNQSIDMINYIYHDNIKLNLEHGINHLADNLNSVGSLNITGDILKDIFNNQLFLSLIYALGISIKTIILVFSFI
jgi:hypothetical protein